MKTLLHATIAIDHEFIDRAVEAIDLSIELWERLMANGQVLAKFHSAATLLALAEQMDMNGDDFSRVQTHLQNALVLYQGLRGEKAFPGHLRLLSEMLKQIGSVARVVQMEYPAVPVIEATAVDENGVDESTIHAHEIRKGDADGIPY
jgi:hypothetical protein